MSLMAWSVAIFSSREDADTLQRTIDAVTSACGSRPATIDVLVDSNPEAAGRLAGWAPSLGTTSTIRLWLVSWRDKACTWNRYVHEIAPAADAFFFVDGYVRPRADSLALLAEALDREPSAWAATAVPTVGPSAARQRASMQDGGALHGNLYVLRNSVVDLFRKIDFRLPLGLYRNDSLIGAVILFGADPARQSWTPSRIRVVDRATWEIDSAPLLSVARLRSYVLRRGRQAQGDLETAAIQRHLAVRKLAPEELPSTVRELLAEGPSEALTRQGPIGRWLMRRAARRITAGRDWSSSQEPFRLVKTWEGGCGNDPSSGVSVR